MCDKRKRFNSALTFEEFVDQHNQLPDTPQLKPIKQSTLFIPELDLANDVSQNQLNMPLQTILEEEPTSPKEIMKTKKSIRKRQRFFSENSQYSVINILERKLQKKKTLIPTPQNYDSLSQPIMI
ncbi:unnamed protein product (macronuclear) [Paramecium tetraurelia]|uniref:Uncharacterized protein n=1 Tax=Paramecium tetraurelia TaxID=5888 RepID=A0DF09_PARTE|nr:uncharacterized protein GSPATT00016452001 [Paramecium tetraurelia]CAK81626.1 unnamed protein product [Paramecium tetraurelia]|eukprot:XP_001449023.1 hypothetical protein (macronuclear) [Paramecium tetraurelia strain d4-2]